MLDVAYATKIGLITSKDIMVLGLRFKVARYKVQGTSCGIKCKI
jgi:hypothetical protein